MSFAARADAPTRALPPGNPCTVGALLKSLPEEEREGLQRMLDDQSRTHVAIYRDILEEGHYVARMGVSRHRKRECMCDLRGMR